MKFFAAIVAYVVIGAILGAGILKAVHGSFWLLIAAVLAYVISFGRSCIPPKSHH